MRIRRFLELQPDERRLFLAAAARLIAARALLATVGLGRTRRLLAARRATSADPARAERAARAVLRAAHMPLRTTCLDRAVALWWLLHAQGVGAELRIGVSRDAEMLAAHAWVECDGRILLDEGASAFAAFDVPVLGERK